MLFEDKQNRSIQRAVKKVMKKDLDNKEALINEINILKEMDHPNIIRATSV